MPHGKSAREDESLVIPMRGRAFPDIAVAPVDCDDLNSPHTLAVLAIPPGSTVLDVGCGPGVVAKALSARGCSVWGLEIDPRRASSARKYCVEVREGDIEAIALTDAFEGLRFDAILFLDVLEHLRDPGAVLAGAAELLAPGGRVLISIPNVTHGALRLELLSGRFRYRSSGLLDRGHLRFFDAEAVDELIREAGLHAESRLRVVRRLDQTEFDIDVAGIPGALRSELEGNADAQTYQFFVIARPARASHSDVEGITLLERQQARIHDLSGALAEGSAYARHLQEELAAKDARLREIDGGAAAADRARLEQLTAALENGGAYAVHLREELAATTARLREVESTYDGAQRDIQALSTRLAESEQVLRDLRRTAEDGESYVGHLEGELRRRAGDIAVRDDEMCVLRAHIEKTERTIHDRDGEIADRDAALGRLRARIEEVERSLAGQEALRGELALAQTALADQHARTENAERSLREMRELATQLSTLLEQPRYRLAEKGNAALKRWMPVIHRLVRPMVARRRDDPGPRSGSRPHRGAD